jgi:hypothetical protein
MPLDAELMWQGLYIIYIILYKGLKSPWWNLVKVNLSSVWMDGWFDFHGLIKYVPSSIVWMDGWFDYHGITKYIPSSTVWMDGWFDYHCITKYVPSSTVWLDGWMVGLPWHYKIHFLWFLQNAVILGFSNSWFQKLQETVTGKIVFRWILYSWFKWTMKSTKIKTPRLIIWIMISQ